MRNSKLEGAAVAATGLNAESQERKVWHDCHANSQGSKMQLYCVCNNGGIDAIISKEGQKMDGPCMTWWKDIFVIAYDPVSMTEIYAYHCL